MIGIIISYGIGSRWPETIGWWWRDTQITRGWLPTMWSSASCALTLACWPSVSNKLIIINPIVTTFLEKRKIIYHDIGYIKKTIILRESSGHLFVSMMKSQQIFSFHIVRIRHINLYFGNLYSCNRIYIFTLDNTLHNRVRLFHHIIMHTLWHEM